MRRNKEESPMKLLFVHDHPFFEEKDKVYSGGAFPASIWANYLKNFKQINVFGRRTNSTASKVVLSSLNENVHFNLTNNYSSIKSLIKNYSSLKAELLVLIEPADVVLVRLPSVLGVIASFVAFTENKKVWTEVVGNGNETLSNHGSFLGKVSAPILNVLMKKAIRKSDFVSYVTLSKLQLDYPANKNAITVSISNVVLTRIINKSDIDLHRFTSKKLKIALIGGFNAKYKGQDVLLRAVNLLPDEIKENIEFYFIGIGDSRWLEELSKNLNLNDNIAFIGSKESGEPILSLLQEMSLYIQPSLTEGMPRALLEAMSMGCPAMGSRVGGIPDVISENLLHHKGDFKIVAKQLKRLFLDRQILIDESLRSLEVIEPYLKTELDNKRKKFYTKINEDLLKG